MLEVSVPPASATEKKKYLQCSLQRCTKVVNGISVVTNISSKSKISISLILFLLPVFD